MAKVTLVRTCFVSGRFSQKIAACPRAYTRKRLGRVLIESLKLKAMAAGFLTPELMFRVANLAAMPA